MTPPGHIRSDGRGGLRVIIEETEHLVTADDAAHLLYAGDIALLQDPDPAPLLRGEPRRKTGHIIPSRDDGDETPHLTICVYPDRVFVALRDEVAAVRAGRLDICKVVGVKVSEVEI